MGDMTTAEKQAAFRQAANAGAAGPVQRLTNEPEQLNTVQLAARALATQSKPQTLAECLTPGQQEWLAATLDENGLATADVLNDAGDVVSEGTARVVKRTLDEYYEGLKATNADDEPPPPEPDAGPADPHSAQPNPSPGK